MTAKAKSQVPIQTEWVTVKSVNWDDKTMVGTGELNDLDYEDVLLGLGAVYKKPKVGSLALVGKINNSAGCFLIDCEGYEEIELNTELTNLQVKKQGIRLKRNEDDLLSVLNAMHDELTKVFTSNGLIYEVPKWLLFKERLNSILTSD